jgi:hypothetical protein
MEAIRLQKKLAMGVNDSQTKACNKSKSKKEMACGGAVSAGKKGKKNG